MSSDPGEAPRRGGAGLADLVGLFMAGFVLVTVIMVWITA